MCSFGDIFLWLERLGWLAATIEKTGKKIRCCCTVPYKLLSFCNSNKPHKVELQNSFRVISRPICLTSTSYGSPRTTRSSFCPKQRSESAHLRKNSLNSRLSSLIQYGSRKKSRFHAGDIALRHYILEIVQFETFSTLRHKSGTEVVLRRVPNPLSALFVLHES